MGEPVISIPISNMSKKDPEIFKTIEYWTALETQNYYWRNLGIKIYRRAVKYSTNHVPTALPEIKIFYSSSGTTKSQKEMAAIILMHELYHEYAGTDGKSPKKKWENLSQAKKEFYMDSIKVLEQLSPNLVDNVKKFYPEIQ